MNKHTRLVVSVLFFVIIILAIGITRFYLDVSKNTGKNNAPTEIIRKLDIDDDGNRIFEGAGSLYGVVDVNNKVIVAPEWPDLEFAGNNLCIASKRIGEKLLTGCIDYEGNITVPFIYKNISRYEADNFVFYAAESDFDGSYVIYDKDFVPCFMRSWDGCSVNGGELLLSCGESSFSYTFGENGFICKNADVSGEVLGCSFQLNVYSRILLSKLDCSMLDKISEDVSRYLEFAFTGNRSVLGDLADSGFFTPLFPDEVKITDKQLLDISDIFIYAEKSENGSQSYVISIIADTQIDYTDENEESLSLEDSYKAVMRFVSSGSDITAVSGDFVKSAPDYPAKTDDESIQSDSQKDVQDLPA